MAVQEVVKETVGAGRWVSVALFFAMSACELIAITPLHLTYQKRKLTRKSCLYKKLRMYFKCKLTLHIANYDDIETRKRILYKKSIQRNKKRNKDIIMDKVMPENLRIVYHLLLNMHSFSFCNSFIPSVILESIGNCNVYNTVPHIRNCHSSKYPLV